MMKNECYLRSEKIRPEEMRNIFAKGMHLQIEHQHQSKYFFVIKTTLTY